VNLIIDYLTVLVKIVRFIKQSRILFFWVASKTCINCSYVFIGD